MKCLVLFILCVALFTGINKVSAQTASPFTGEKSSWHGFDRYDFVMDDQTFELTPIVAPQTGRERGWNTRKREKTLYRCRSEKCSGWESMVLARLLLGPPASD